MPEGSADCIVTSPPYWAKRDYGVAGQYGCEPDPVSYVATLRALFRELRRVLADDGTCWLNLGDSYSAGSASPSGKHAYIGSGLMGRHTPGIETKNLLGLPWRVALALQDDVAARRYGLGGGYAAHPQGRNPGDVWSIPTRPYRGPHFAAYPVELPTRCIKAGCKPGGMVLDPFCGTGTTGIAALALGRQFTGIELNPAFAALAAERLRHAAQPEPEGTEGGRP